MDFGTLAGLGIIIGVIFTLAQTMRPGAELSLSSTTPNSPLLLEATYRLPAPPLSLVFSEESEGYIGFFDGKIMRFELPPEPGSEIIL